MKADSEPRVDMVPPAVLVDALRDAVESKEAVLLTLSPAIAGEMPVQVKVLAVAQAGYAFDVLKIDDGRRLTWRTEQIKGLQVGSRHLQSNGEKYRDPDAQARWEARELVSRAHMDALAPGTGPELRWRDHVRVVGSKTATMAGRAITLYTLVCGDNKATIAANSAAAADRIAHIVADDVTYYDIAPALLRAGFWWPAWARLQADCAAQLRELRGGTPSAGLPQTWAASEQRQADYAAAGFEFDDVDGDPTMPLNLMEADRVLLMPLLRFAQGKDPMALRDWLRASWKSQQHFEGCPGTLSPAATNELKRAGLIVREPLPGLDEVLQGVRLADFRKRSVEEGLELKFRNREMYIDWFRNNSSPQREAFLRQVSRRQHSLTFVLPEGVNWDEFQVSRWSYENMFSLLEHWLLSGRAGRRCRTYFQQLV